MFAEFIISKNPSNLGKCAMLSTVVSSKLLGKMAETRGFVHEATLTGFKHLGNLAWDLEHNGGGIRTLFAFEEAIGFMVGTTVLEKDGISALLLALCLLHSLRTGDSLQGYLDAVHAKYGHYRQHNSYFKCPPGLHSPDVFKFVRRQLENDGLRTKLGIKSVKDYAPSSMITMELERQLTITLRTSGTEPKIKYYAESSAMETDSALISLVDEVLAEVMKPEMFKLVKRFN